MDFTLWTPFQEAVVKVSDHHAAALGSVALDTAMESHLVVWYIGIISSIVLSVHMSNTVGFFFVLYEFQLVRKLASKYRVDSICAF